MFIEKQAMLHQLLLKSSLSHMIYQKFLFFAEKSPVPSEKLRKFEHKQHTLYNRGPSKTKVNIFAETTNS